MSIHKDELFPAVCMKACVLKKHVLLTLLFKLNIEGENEDILTEV